MEWTNATSISGLETLHWAPDTILDSSTDYIVIHTASHSAHLSSVLEELTHLSEGTAPSHQMNEHKVLPEVPCAYPEVALPSPVWTKCYSLRTLHPAQGSGALTGKLSIGSSYI